MRVCAISDIHWRGTQRHEEYTRAFELLFSQLREDRPDIIVCTGDIWHTKTQGITPEVIDKLVWMFSGLAEIAPLHMILGNHDGNLTNEDRQDAISPIVDAMQNDRVFLYKRSGVYSISDAVPPTNLCVFSCFDRPGWKTVSPRKGFNIALFHGSVQGCQTDTLWRMKDGEVTVEFFDGYDIAMLGDIHKTQILGWKEDRLGASKPWIGYPGSLIQQNHGEEKVKGYFLWDITTDTWDCKFRELKNMAPFLTVPWLGDVDSTVASVEECHGARIRVSSASTLSRLETRQLTAELKTTKGIADVAFKFEASNKPTTIETNGVQVHKSCLRNDVDALLHLYDTYINDNPSRHPLTDDQVVQAHNLINTYLAKTKQSEQDSDTRDVLWSIKELEFDNLFRYGTGNRLDFGKMSGIVGIFGNNRSGKSSVVGSLMFGLYGSTDRGPVKNAYIVNKNKASGSCRVLFSVDDQDYYLVRNVAKSQKRKGVVDEEKAATSLKLYKVANGEMVSLATENAESRTDTDKVVRRLIGSPQDFLMTSFANQGGINKFIEEGATERKAILNRFLDLDIFDKLFKMASDDKAVLNARAATLSSDSWEASSQQTEKHLRDLEALAVETQGAIAELRTSLSAVETWFHNHNTSSVGELTNKIERTKVLISQLVQQQSRNKRSIDKLHASLPENDSRRETLAQIISSTNVQDLVAKKSLLGTLTKDYSSVMSRVSAEKSKHEQQQRSVRKLDLVPCGTQFPNCHYIKDAHEDKSLIDEQAALLSTLTDSCRQLKNELEVLEKQQIDAALVTYHAAVQQTASLEKDRDSMLRELALLEENQHSTENNTREQQTTLDQLNLELLSKENSEHSSKLAERANLASKISRLDSKLLETMVSVGTARARLERLTKEREEGQVLLSKLRVTDSIVQGFSKNQIPATILKTQLPGINTEMDRILSGVVDFKLSLETEPNSNTLDVFIEDGSSRRVIELGSGMEKMIASLTIRAALSGLSSLPKPDLFIIDEGFGSLDQQNCGKVVELLQSLKSMFKTILIISHVSEIKEAADIIIDIAVSDTESKIVW